MLKNIKENIIADQQIFKISTKNVTSPFGAELYPIETKADVRKIDPDSKTDVYVKKLPMQSGAVCVKPRHNSYADEEVEGVCKCVNKYTAKGVCKLKKYVVSDNLIDTNGNLI